MLWESCAGSVSLFSGLLWVCASMFTPVLGGGAAEIGPALDGGQLAQVLALVRFGLVEPVQLRGQRRRPPAQATRPVQVPQRRRAEREHQELHEQRRGLHAALLRVRAARSWSWWRRSPTWSARPCTFASRLRRRSGAGARLRVHSTSLIV